MSTDSTNVLSISGGLGSTTNTISSGLSSNGTITTGVGSSYTTGIYQYPYSTTPVVYPEVSITRAENGFVVSHQYKTFVFNSLTDLLAWMAATIK